MTKTQVIKALRQNIKASKNLIKGLRTDKAKWQMQGLHDGYKFCLELLLQK